jgi:hypothetical protein
MYTGPNIIRNGLVLALDAANTKSYVSGSTVWRDLSMNNNSGSLINGPTFSSAYLGGIAFDGVNDYVNCGRSTSLNSISTAVTINAVVTAPTFYTDYVGIVMKTTDFNWNNGFGMYYEDFVGKRYAFYVNVWNGPRVVYPISSTNQINPIVLTGTYSTTTGLKLFVNGSLYATTSYSTAINNPSGINLNVGCGNTAEYFYRGNIYNTQVYNRALNDSEVLQNYNATKARFGL